jgi:hypothetical protein
MVEIIYPVNKIKNNVVNRNLSTKQYDEILTLLNNNNTNRIRYWFNGEIVLIKTEAFNK